LLLWQKTERHRVPATASPPALLMHLSRTITAQGNTYPDSDIRQHPMLRVRGSVRAPTLEPRRISGRSHRQSLPMATYTRYMFTTVNDTTPGRGYSLVPAYALSLAVPRGALAAQRRRQGFQGRDSAPMRHSFGGLYAGHWVGRPTCSGVEKGSPEPVPGDVLSGARLRRHPRRQGQFLCLSRAIETFQSRIRTPG